MTGEAEGASSAHLKRLQRRARPSWFRRAWMDWYLPKPESTAMIAVFSACVFVLTLWYRLTENAAWISTWSATPVLGPIVRVLQTVAVWVNQTVDSQMLVAIHTALTGAVFAVLIAITVSMRREEETDKTRVLLRASAVYPLALWAVLGYPTLMLRGNVPYKVLPPIMLASFTAWHLRRLLLVLLDRNRFRVERTALLKDLLKRHMDVTEHKRLAMENLQAQLDYARVKLVYFRFTPEGSPYHNIYPLRSGVVTGLNLRPLKELADAIEDAANDDGFVFRADNTNPGPQDTHELPTEAGQGDRLTENRRRFLVAGYGDVVYRGRPVIRFDQELVCDPGVLADVQRLALRAFKIDAKYEDLTSALRPDLEGIRDQFAQAIRDNSQRRIDEYVRTYRELAMAFAEYIRDWKRDSRLLPQDDSDEAGPAMHETEWILSDIRHVINTAVLIKSPESISQAGSLGVEIALAMCTEPPLFLSFLNEPCHALLTLASRQLDDKLRGEVVGAITGWMEHVAWVLSDRVKAALDDRGSIPVTLTRSVRNTLNVAQNLVWTACLHKHKEDLLTLLDKADGLFASIADGSHDDESELEMTLRYGHPSGRRRAVLLRVKDRIRALEELQDDIFARKRKMHFRMAGWLLERRRREREVALWTDLYANIEARLPSELQELADAYLYAGNEVAQDLWDSVLWEDPPHRATRTYSVGRVFCMKALRLIAEGQDGAAKLKPVAGLAWAASGEQGLLQMLSEMSRPGAEWEQFLEDKQKTAIPTLKQLLERVKREYDDSELVKITKAPVDDRCVRALADGVVEGFRDGSQFRLLLKRLGKYEERLTQVPQSQAGTFFGFSELRDKQEFVEGNDDHARRRGIAVSEALAEGEDAFLAGLLLGWCQVVSVDAISELLDQFAQSRSLAKAILLTRYTSLSEYFLRNPSYVPRNTDPQRECIVPHQLGWTRHGDLYVPVIPIHVERRARIKKNEVVAVVDTASVGCFVQYKPVPVDGDPTKVRGQWYVDVGSMNDLTDQVAEFLKTAPGWLKAKGEPSEQERHLRTLVWFRVLERFSFEKPNDFCGLRLASAGAQENSTGSSGTTSDLKDEDANSAE